MGDVFVTDMVDELYKLKHKAISQKKSQPYIFQFYNVKTFTPDAATGINKLLTPLITALNGINHLPEILLIVPDIDLLANMPQPNSSFFIGGTIHYIIKQIDLALERRRQDLSNKHPGSLPGWKTKIIWCRILKRPPCQLENPLERFFMLRGKFNSILEERLLDGDAQQHHIISTDVDPVGYDLTGKLNTSGAADFWFEIAQGLRRFDLNEIKLRLRQYAANKPIPDQQNRRRKLPTPPANVKYTARSDFNNPECNQHRNAWVKRRLDYENSGRAHHHHSSKLQKYYN